MDVARARADRDAAAGQPPGLAREADRRRLCGVDVADDGGERLLRVAPPPSETVGLDLVDPRLEAGGEVADGVGDNSLFRAEVAKNDEASRGEQDALCAAAALKQLV